MGTYKLVPKIIRLGNLHGTKVTDISDLMYTILSLKQPCKVDLYLQFRAVKLPTADIRENGATKNRHAIVMIIVMIQLL